MEAVKDDDSNLYRKFTNENEYLHSTKGIFDRFGIHLRQKYVIHIFSKFFAKETVHNIDNDSIGN